MDLKAMLDLQRIDVLIDQTRHALEHLAERDTHVLRERELAALRSSRDDLRRERQAQDAALAGIEEESRTTQSLRQRLEAQLRTVIAPREAEALQHEIQTLVLKASDLDDRGLELLEAASQAEGVIAAVLEQERTAVEAEHSARVNLEAAIAAIDHELDRLAERRQTAARNLSTGDLDVYETKRRALGGIAVTEISKGVCGGCHMDISISELDAIKRLPPDAVAECPNCNRILVR